MLRRAALVVTVLSAGCVAATGVLTPQPFPSASNTPTSSSTATSGVPHPDALVRAALALRGVRYRLGGDEPATGFDCSGLVHYVFEEYHIDVPRTVAEQYQIGRRVSLDDVRPGDLLFFSTTGPGATHVGIALGSSNAGEFVHAPVDGGVVRVERFDSSYWRSRLVGVRRIL